MSRGVHVAPIMLALPLASSLTPSTPRLLPHRCLPASITCRLVDEAQMPRIVKPPAQSVKVKAPAQSAKSASTAADSSRTEGALLMMAVALLWGTNFPAVKATIGAGLPSSAAAALRFSIAGIALLPLLAQPTADEDGGDDARLPRDLITGGLECGCWLALGYIAQALALHDLPAGAVAFLASLQVVFVPLVVTATGGASLTPRLAAAAALCVSGVGLLESGGIGSVGDAGSTAASLAPALLELASAYDALR